MHGLGSVRERWPRRGHRTAGRRRLGLVLALVGLFLSVAPPSHAQEQVTITLLYRQDGTGTAERWIEEFEALHPHIKVEWQPRTGSDWQEKLLLEMMAGTAPDVFEFWSPFNQQLRQRDLLLNLTPYMQRDFTEEEIADFYPAVWEASFTRFGRHAGEQYIMPRYINVMTFFYNKDRFHRAGVANPAELDAYDDWTWDTFREAARKLTVVHEDGARDYGVMLGIYSLPRVLNWIWGAGGDILDPQEPTRFIGHEAEAVAAIQFLSDIIWKDGSSPSTWGDSGWLSGRFAMIEDAMASTFRYKGIIDGRFEWDVIRRPAGPAGRPGYLVDDSFGIWAQTPHPEEAWQLVKFLVSKRGQEIMVEQSGLPPVRRSAAEAYFALDPNLNLRAFADAVMDARPTIYSRMPGNISEIHTLLWETISDSLLRNMQPYPVAIESIRSAIELLLQSDPE